MAKVYEYNELIDSLLNTNLDGIDEETGVVFDVTLLDKLEMERNDKLENLLLYTAQIESDAEEIKAYAKTLSARAKTKENKANGLRAWLAEEIVRYGGKRFETNKIRATVSERDAVHILDENLLPPGFMRIKTETKPSLTAIKAAIAAGEDVPGAELVKSKSVQIK